MTHRHPHEHAHDKTPPPRASQRPRRATRDDGRDETTGRRLPAYRHDDEATTPPLADTTTKRPTPRRIAATRPTTRKHGTNDGTRETGSEARRKAGRKKTDRPSERKAARKTGRDMRLNDTLLTTRHCHRNRNPPANEGNQGDENDNTHIVPASSQSPLGYHQSTKS